jgi:hypothetical protein
MKKIVFSLILIFAVIGLIVLSDTVYADSLIQLPTEMVATVTSTPKGPTVTVRADLNLDQINVRSGPGAIYAKIGVLLKSQEAPAKGKSPKGEWYLIEYPGVPGGLAWVSADLVNLSPGSFLEVVEPPSTPTPNITSTIDPTLAAQFVVTLEASRMPTFTAPPPIVIPTFLEPTSSITDGLPLGLIIIGLFSLGVIIGFIALARGR